MFTVCLPLSQIRHVLLGLGYGFLFSWLFAKGKLTCLNLELRVPLPLRKDMVLPLKLNEGLFGSQRKQPFASREISPGGETSPQARS